MYTNQKTKKKLSLLPLFLRGLGVGLLLIALAGCPGESPIDNPDNPNNPSNPETPVNAVMQNVALTGLVKDAGGNPLSGVTVTTGSLNATTGGDGTFSFTQAGTVDSTVVVKFEKSGYFTLTRSGAKRSEVYMEAALYPKGNSNGVSLQTSFDAAKATTLQVGGVKIELPASCFANTNGSAYSGTVRADVLNLGSGNANTALMIPGGDLATDKSDEMMLPIGMVDVIFTDNAGNLLKIKEKTDVRMTWPAPAGATSLPSSIPLWTFNEARGIWLEEGSATLQGNIYTGTVSHFTPKGAGKRSKTAIMQIHATECDNKPAAGAKVTFYDVDDDGLGILDNEYKFLYETYFTNSAGDCSVKVPINWKYWTVNVTYKGQNQRQAFTQGNMGGQSVYFKFENGCNAQIPEVCAIRYHVIDPGVSDFMYYLSWDNYGKRWRTDCQDTDGQYVTIDVMDNLTKTHYTYYYDGDTKWRTNAKPEDWGVWHIEDGDKHAIMLYQVGDNFTFSVDYTINGEVEFSNLKGYTKTATTKNILGKTCNLWENKAGDQIYEWKKVIMMRKDATGIFQVEAITDNVPASAFTNQTVLPKWIQ